ncbi:MAG: transposase [Candidatus Thermoplasmatota archaeon]|nr:transposase [Candidatus Thermoplasmatota archaeon]MBU4369604.1 transposase [Patescibacteria group bacterium]MCG2701454.1 transposase [Candidatus Parcubacteria bacterium]MCG2708304.1 transposase [Candidatus Omnitrophota bacterium]
MSAHRKFNPQLKFKIVLEAIKREKSHTEIARQYGIHPQMVANWKREFFQKGSAVFERDQKKEVACKKMEELEKIIGQQTIEIQLLKKFLGHAS